MEQVESAPLRATRDPPSEGAELWNFIPVGDRSSFVHLTFVGHSLEHKRTKYESNCCPPIWRF
jgi:hypothetical protein